MLKSQTKLNKTRHPEQREGSRSGSFSRSHGLKMTISLLIILGTIALIWKFTSKNVEAAWFDDNYAYRQKITIGNTGAADSNKKVKFDIDTATLVTAGKIQSDCDDTRFTDNNGKILLYFLDSAGGACNGASTDYYVLYETINAGNTDIYMYFGNPSAGSGSQPAQFSQSTFAPTSGPTLASEEKSPGPISYWKFDEGTGSSAYDSTLRANTLTVALHPSWWDNNYALRKQITVAAAASNTVNSGYSTVFTASGADAATIYNSSLSTGDDFRVLYWNGSTWTALDRDLITFTSTSIEVRWALSAGITGGTSDSNYYFYFNYSGAVSPPNNKDNVYRFQDDFNGGSLDTAKWNTNATVNCCTSGYVYLAPSLGAQGNLISKVYQITDGIMEYRALTSAKSIDAAWVMNSFTRSSVNTGNAYGSGGTITYQECNSACSSNIYQHSIDSAYSTPWAYTASTWYYSRIINNGQVITFDTFTDGGFSSLLATTSHTYTTARTTGYLGAHNTGTRKSQWDWVRVRDYVATEPTVTVGANLTSTILSWQSADLCLSSKCLYFNGSSPKVTAASAVTPTGAKSISFWLRTGTTTAQYLYDNTNASDANTGISIDINSTANKLRVRLNKGTGGTPNYSLVSATSVNDNKWHFIETTWDGTTGANKAILYVDGKQDNVGTAASATDNTPTTSLIIGASTYSTPANFFNGFLDEIKIYNYARTASQVITDYSSRGISKGTSASLGASADNNMALSSGLNGYWKMDETSANTCSGGVNDSCDSSGNSNNGAWNGNSASTAGKFGPGVSFDGTGDYVTVGMGSFTSSEGSISIWGKAASASPSNSVFLIGRNQAGNVAGDINFIINVSTFKIDFTLQDGTNTRMATSNAVVDTSWHHYVGTWDGNNVILYVDGIKQSTVAAGINLSAHATRTMAIGAANGEGATLDGFPWNGTLDEARIYKRTLSATEVSNLYNWAPGPVAYWKLDDNTSTSATDSSGNGKTGTLTNTPTWAPGKYGSAVAFAGSNQHIIRADDADLDFVDDANMTVTTWFKHTTASVQEILVSKYNEAGYKVIMESDGDITCALDYDLTWTPTDSATSTAATYDDGNWHHIACVKNGASSLVLYIDGVPITTDSTITATNTLTNSDPIYFGIDADGTSNDFTGSMDDIKIYSYARSSKQIVEDMNAGHPFAGSPIGSQVGYWKMDEIQGTTANDASSLLANNLTLSAASWTTSGKINAAWNGTGATWLSRADDADFDFDATDDLSTSGWFKSDSATNPGATEYLVNKASATAAGYAVYVNTSGQICFGIDDDATWGPDVASCTTTDYYDATWHHFEAVRNTTLDTIAIYVDASQKDNDNDPTTATLANSLLLYIGDRDGVDNGDEFNGDLDEVKIYRGALTADEIKIDYNAGSAVALGGVLGTQDNEGFGGNAPFLYYSMDENTNNTCVGGTNDVCDKSGNEGEDGAITGAIWGVGKYGSGVVFDGTDDKVQTADDIDLDLGTGSFTITAWVKNNGDDDDFVIFKRGGADNLGYTIYIGASGRVRYQIGDGTNVVTNTPGTTDISDNSWHHVVMTTDRTNNIGRIYIDGKQEGSDISISTVTGTLANTIDLYIGVDNNSNGDFQGTMDEIKYYNYVRTQAQIAYDMNRGAPVAWYKFDECQGATAYNTAPAASGLAPGNNGTITPGAGPNTSVGTCGSGTTSEMWNDGTTGKRNASLGFDGTDDFVSIADTANLRFDSSAEDFSLFAWVKRTTTGTEYIMSKEDADNDGWRLMFDSNNKIVCSEDATDITGVTAVTDTNWHLIGCTVDRDGNGKVYLDAKQDGTTVSMGTDAMATTSILSIGARSYTAANFFNGLIDEIRIYNYVVSENQIKQIYNNGAVFFGPATGSP